MFFKEVIGQSSIKEHIVNTVKENKVSHAYLLAGNEGNGALPLAMAFASYLNCLNPSETDACEKCSSCLKARKLIHPDIHFVYPVIKKGSSATISDDYISKWRSFVLSNPYFNILQWFSQIGDEKKSGMIYVDESLSIIKKLNLKNFEGKYKIMIIWLPERMNDSGANKLLKILEEPPPSTVFLLVSENPGALLHTILSRTQRINVPPIDYSSITEELANRFSLSHDEANVAARLSNGNYVKAVEYLDSDADSDTGFMDNFITLMRAAFAKKIFDIDIWVSEMSGLSRDTLKNFCVYSIGMLRDSFIYNYNQPELVFLSQKEKDFVSKFSPFITREVINNMVEELELVYEQIEQNGNAKIILFDMAIKFITFFKKR